MKILQKTTMALAVSMTIASTGVMAGTLNYSSAGHTTGVVLANEVFGAGSDATLVAIPQMTYTVTNNALLATEEGTIKLTLDSGAVFGEDLSSIDKWNDAGVTLEFTVGNSAAAPSTIIVGGVGSTPAPNYGSEISTIEVIQGGAIGDNTVTFKLTAAAAPGGDNATLNSVDVGGFKVKNLKAALERGVSNPAVKLGAEFRNLSQTPVITDTVIAKTILSSQDGVALSGTFTDYKAGGGRARIDVADTELSFTGDIVGNTGANAATDFDETDNKDFVTLGTLSVVRTEYLQAGAGSDTSVKKEDANDFDFNGSDNIGVVITSTASLASYSSVYLSASTCAANPSPSSDFIGNSVVGDPNSRRINLSGETTIDLNTGYNVCAVASGSAAIPESTITASLDVEYFNPRYTNSEDTLDYGQILRNGCQVTLFNVPAPDSPDSAAIRLTNVSEKPGAVRAFMWTQDGTQIDLNSELVPSLAAHATTVLKTNPGQTGNGYLGDNMPTYAASKNVDGRNRLVIQGAFPACEALGLVRTPSGVLTNLTSTTYSGDSSRLGAQNNGTSNTSN